MKKITLGLVQMSMAKNPENNLGKAIGMIGEAAEKGARIVCLPELFTSLYFPQEEKFETEKIAETIPGPTTKALSNTAKENKIFLIGGSIYEKSGNVFYNTTVVFDDDGKILGKYRKIHVPHDAMFYEQNYFKDGDLNYQVFQSKYANIGTMICYDQWYPEAARINALMGADIIFYPSAIGWAKGIEPTEGNWQEAWENVQRGHAIANSIIVSAVNRVGQESNMKFWGGSFVIDQFGKTLVRGSGKEEVLVVSCDIGLGKQVREGWRFFYNRRPDTYQRLLK